jgi:transposase
MRNYTGKKVYVGMDVHKRTTVVACMCEGTIIKKSTLQGQEGEAVVKFLSTYFPGAQLKTAYEAGFSGFHLHRHLVKAGIDNSVIHAASIEVSARDRVKTDKRDAVKIATQLAAGRLRGIRVPTPEREAKRELSRMREKLAVDKRRVGNRVKSLLYRHGLLGAEEVPVLGKRWLEGMVKHYSGDVSIKKTLEMWQDLWLHLREQIKSIDKALALQAEQDTAMEMIYQSAPGIGPHHARVLANELEDLKQFQNEKQLFSFTGLTPSEHSSGEHQHQGHITRQGRPAIRKILVEAAWVAVRTDKAMSTIFKRVAQTAGKKRAIIGIARRLIGRLRSCFMHGVLYEYGYEKKSTSTACTTG